MDIQVDFAPDPADPTRRRLEQLERLLGCFQRALGHELPNRLVALQGLARLTEMEQADRLDEEGRGRLLRLADLARRTDEAVRRLAEVGRLTRDAGPAEAASLPDAAREAAAEVNLLFSGWSIGYQFHPEATTVRVPPRALRLVLAQLVRNAVEAGGGRAVPIEVGSRPVVAGVEWWVKDDGRGFTEGRPDGPFEPFVGGAGLGLFLVRQLVAGWGGAVRVRSEAGRGTTITLLARTP